MIRVIGQRGVVDLLHLGVVCQEFDHLLGVLHMALDAQAQGLGALQQQECIERGDGGTGIAQQDGADVGDEGGREKIFRLSMNLKASSRPPLMLKVKMDAPPLGKYFSYRA